MRHALVLLVSAGCAAAPASGGRPTPVEIAPPEPVASEEPEAAPAAPVSSATKPKDCPPAPTTTEAVAPEKIAASHLVIMYAGALRSRPEITRTQAEAKAVAEELLLRLCKGESFAEIARRHSDDPGSAERAGSLGFFGRNVMVKPFSDAAFALVPGQFSGVVETDFGYHIILRTK